MKFYKNRHFIRASIAFAAAVLMHYTPDNIDDIIKLFLVAYGIADLTNAQTTSR